MSHPSVPRVVALVCARNEEVHLARCIEDWIAEGCDVVLIDHDSDDRSQEIARRYLGRGLLGIERLPWKGYFSLKDQMQFKYEIARSLAADWIVHADADEWLCAPPAMGRTLADGIARVHADGYTCINFHEFVFVPWPDEEFRGTHYSRVMTTYYFFQPCHPHDLSPMYPRLMRAWRRDIPAHGIHSGGHTLEGEELRMSPIDFNLRHYVALSVEHACRKYLARQFDPAELADRWHENRVDIDPARFALRPAPQLKRLPRWNVQAFDDSTPSRRHFWEADFATAHGPATEPAPRPLPPSR